MNEQLFIGTVTCSLNRDQYPDTNLLCQVHNIFPVECQVHQHTILFTKEEHE